MVLTKHRPRHDEALVPVEKPRGVAPAPLAGRPGIAAEVLRELRAADAPPTPAEQIRHALTMVTAPLAKLLNQAAPRTDWADALLGIEADTAKAITRLTTDVVRKLDTIQNVWLFAEHQLRAEVLTAVAEVEADLVDGVANEIRAEASL